MNGTRKAGSRKQGHAGVFFQDGGGVPTIREGECKRLQKGGVWDLRASEARIK